MNTIQNLREEVGQTLMTFQLLEEGIREYLDIAMKIIKKNVKDLPIKISPSDKNDSLGRLVGKFANLNDRNDLIEMLKKINKKRVKIAHSFWLEYIKGFNSLIRPSSTEKMEQILNNFFSKKFDEVQKIESDAHTCLIILTTELQRIKGLL